MESEVQTLDETSIKDIRSVGKSLGDSCNFDGTFDHEFLENIPAEEGGLV